MVFLIKHFFFYRHINPVDESRFFPPHFYFFVVWFSFEAQLFREVNGIWKAVTLAKNAEFSNIKSKESSSYCCLGTEGSCGIWVTPRAKKPPPNLKQFKEITSTSRRKQNKSIKSSASAYCVMLQSSFVCFTTQFGYRTSVHCKHKQHGKG